MHSVNENDLLTILKPVLNSNSVWKSHALYLLAEYFIQKIKQKQKIFLIKYCKLKMLIKILQMKHEKDLIEI